MKYTWKIFEVGDANEAGAICGISGDTFQTYGRREWTSYRPPPRHVHRDDATGKMMYPLRVVKDFDGVHTETVEEWHADRPGSGNWGGAGGRAHHYLELPTNRTGEGA